MHLSEPLHTLEEFPVGFFLLVGILVASLLISRPFCRYLCPMGAFLGLINKFSPFKVKRGGEACTNCSRCTTVCPVGIDVQQQVQMNKSECISCGECVSSCRRSESIGLQLGTKTVRPLLLGLIIISLFFGSILITRAAGLYRSTHLTIEQMKASGTMQPDHIKGYMTLREVSCLFELPLAELYQELDLDAVLVPPDTPCRDISMAAAREFDTDEVRLTVARLLDIPADQVTQTCGSGEGTFIPGTMTLQEVSATQQIPLETLYAKLRLEPDVIPPSTACRELKFLVSPDFHTTVVRQAVADIKAAGE